MERLLTAYQEDLLSLDELRRRMPELRAREESMRAERQAILDQAADRTSFLRLAETLTARVIAVAANSLLDRAFGKPKPLLSESEQEDPPVIEHQLDWHSMSNAEVAAIEAFALAAKARQIASEEREKHEAPAQISTSNE
jgi:hypothetical protein